MKIDPKPFILRYIQMKLLNLKNEEESLRPPKQKCLITPRTIWLEWYRAAQNNNSNKAKQ